MKIIKHHIPFLLFYLIGINFYYCLWHLGSEGDAVNWSFQSLNFYHLWINSNVASVLVFIGLASFTHYYNQLTHIRFGSNRIESWIQLVLGETFFLIFFIIGASLDVHLNVIQDYLMTSAFLSLVLYHGLLFFVLVILVNLSDRLGGFKNIVDYLFKTFSIPQQLDRGFMFIDLNSSTKIAEELKSEKYSLFIRQCFHLLDKIVARYDGIEIYQYVGDEAVLHWNYNDRSKCIQAISLFEDFKELLVRHSDIFMSTYGRQPKFKAALHGGRVVQAELGRNVIHTAFHGEVLHTTSRIVGICHKHKTDLLISHDYFQRLNLNGLKNNYERIDDVVLNGKAHQLTVYKPIVKKGKEIKQNFFESKMTISQ
ncbi:MAG: adenylate/guanylate cyclase domain-containing protein [Bacteroidota bacterium]